MDKFINKLEKENEQKLKEAQTKDLNSSSTIKNNGNWVFNWTDSRNNNISNDNNTNIQENKIPEWKIEAFEKPKWNLKLKSIKIKKPDKIPIFTNFLTKNAKSSQRFRNRRIRSI